MRESSVTGEENASSCLLNNLLKYENFISVNEKEAGLGTGLS